MDVLIDLLPLSYTDAVVVLGALVLGITAGVLGTFAVLRRRSLVGDALAHAALPGVCVAFLLTGAKDPAALLAGAACAGLVGALLMVGIERSSRIRSDAAIGVVLSSFFSLGVVLLTAIAHGSDADQAGLERYLFGQAAGLAERDVVVTGALGLGAVALVALAFRPLKTTLFDPAYAAAAGLPVRLVELAMTALLVVAVVVGVRMVGAILMVAMLVVPATAARQLTGRLALLLPLAGAIGAGVGVGGALLSARAEAPTGPVIVLLGFAVVLLCLAFAPRRGFLWRARRLAAARRRALSGSLLADLAAGPVAPAALAADGRRIRAGQRELRRAGLAERDQDGRLVLTRRGREAAAEALKRRADWGAWLEHGGRLALPDAREPDPVDLEATLGRDGIARLRSLAAQGAVR
jgi:manganese/zinc/iron transport system permease protein